MFIIPIDSKLYLKLLLPSDSKMFFDSIEKNRNYLENHMPRIKETKSIHDSQRVINLFLNQLSENNGFRSAIIYEEAFIGIIGLKYIDWINKKTEIMYWVDSSYSGKGIVTICVKKILDIAFNFYKLNKVILITSEDNVSSQKVALKSGFTLEGVLRKDEVIKDKYIDSLLYSILKVEYKEDN